MTMTEARVRLAEVGTLTAAEERRYKVAPDWRGDPSLSIGDAAQLVRERQDSTAAHEAAWRTHQAANEAWLAGRVNAGRAAAAKATSGMRPSSATFARAREAYLEGALEWQAQHRRPEWNGAPTIHDGVLFSPDDNSGMSGASADDSHMWEVPR